MSTEESRLRVSSAIPCQTTIVVANRRTAAARASYGSPIITDIKKSVTVSAGQARYNAVSAFTSMEVKASTGAVGVDYCRCHNLRVVRVNAANSYGKSVGVDIIVPRSRIYTRADFYLVPRAGTIIVDSVLNPAEWV